MDISCITLPLNLELQHFRQKRPIAVLPLQGTGQQKLPSSSHAVAKLKMLSESDRPFYNSSFIGDYLLIKANSLKKFAGEEFKEFVHHLSIFYNQYIQHPDQYLFRWSQSDAELMAQILLKSKIYQYLSGQQVDEVLDTCGIVAATMIDSYFKVKSFLKKDEEAIVLNMTSLYSRVSPFIKLVHQEKHHKGQIDFAAIALELKILDPKVFVL